MPKFTAETLRDPGLLLAPGLSAAHLRSYAKALKPEARLRQVSVTVAARAAAEAKLAGVRAAKHAALAPQVLAKIQAAALIFKETGATLKTARTRRHRINSALLLHALASASKQSKPATLKQLVKMQHPREAAAISVTRFIIRTIKPTALSAMETVTRKIAGLPLNAELASWGITIDSLYKKFKNDCYFVLTFNAPRSATSADRYRIASAIRQAGKFASVQIERLDTLRLFQPEVLVDPDDLTYKLLPDTEWPLKVMRVDKAWELTPPAGGNTRGHGIVIGHPDSGWRSHPEYDESQIDKEQSFSVLTGNVGELSAIHDLPANPVEDRLHFTHGTGTGSLMVSARGDSAKTSGIVLPQAGNPVELDTAQVQFSGVVPEARIIPVQCIATVVLVGDVNLARAIEYAAGEGAPALNKPVDVISISLGGSPNAALKDIVRTAVRDRHIIVVAAAGQFQVVSDPLQFNTVAEPGAYQDVICATATTRNNHPWSASFHGPSVDIAAPGAGTFQASFKADGTPIVGSGSGTSFSTALVAGVAAMWLGFWGKEFLLAKYPDKPLAYVFRHLLMKTAKPVNTVDGSGVQYRWDDQLFGAGIVDAEALLLAGLPDTAEIVDPPEQDQNLLSWLGNGFKLLGDAIAGGGQLTEDSANEIKSFFQSSQNLCKALVSVAALQILQSAAEIANQLAAQWVNFAAIAGSTTGAVQAEAQQLASASYTTWLTVTEVVEQGVAQAADDAAETANGVVEIVEEVVSTLTDGAEPVINAVAEVLAKFPPRP